MFRTQTKLGSWRHYAPLFHYLESGNAYCYFFETLSQLLCAMLPGADFVQATLQSYLEPLLRVINYVTETQTPLNAQDSSNAFGWSSGHRVRGSRAPEPESWATASVFSYAENLRKLVGVWTRDCALAALPRRNPPKFEDARKTLLNLADTWTGLGWLKRATLSHVYQPGRVGTIRSYGS